METSQKTNLSVQPEQLRVVLTRVFDATPEMVFRVITDPSLIPQWWGPRSLTTVVDQMDVRPGGRWRYIQRDADGSEYAFRGEYREVTPPTRLVMTFEYEGTPGSVQVETTVLEALENGQTRLTATSVFATLKELQAMVAEGMESGAIDTYERLAELLNERRGAPTG